jgi:serine/threonine-protein kinase
MANDTDEVSLAQLDYRVLKGLGTGAGSSILLIANREGGTRYALKVVNRQSDADDIYVAQARHEFEVAQKLRHPNVLRIYDCRVKRSWFRVKGVELLMEYVPGKTLDELGGKLPIGQLVLVFMAVAMALEHMHRRGVYHGDLKPGNIMLSKDGQVKVIDLGTAWLKGHDKGRIQGTPQYMAPEQAHEKVVNAKTDLYNLGATMYRMLTGEYANLIGPHEASGLIGQRLNQVTPPIHLNPKIPGTLNETILRCLASNPEQRPPGAAEVRNQLAAAARYLRVSPPDLQGADADDD